MLQTLYTTQLGWKQLFHKSKLTPGMHPQLAAIDGHPPANFMRTKMPTSCGVGEWKFYNSIFQSMYSNQSTDRLWLFTLA